MFSSVSPPGPGPVFALFDDAGPAGEALLFSRPIDIFVAYRLDEVVPVLERVSHALKQGHWCAGYLAYEAGFAFEPRLHGLGRSGGSAPLVWFASFGHPERIGGQDLPGWLPSGGYADLTPMPLLSPADYRNRVEDVLGYIRQGDIYQLNLTFQAALGEVSSPLAAYRTIRERQRACYGGVLQMGDRTHLSFSPELFFSVKDGVITARPMKGTTARHPDATTDIQARRDLQADAKNRAENLMIVDLMRNDLARIARPGSVDVPVLFAIETYPTVHQMTSTVTAVLREGFDALSVLKSLFPCGSITGAPKIRAMELIDLLEQTPRGPYTGSFGWISPRGDARFNVAIRTVTIDPNGRASLGLGSGIVADSDPDTEWMECLQKAKFLASPGGIGASRSARYKKPLLCFGR